MMVWFLPLVAGVAAGIGTATIWLSARPSATAAATVALGTFVGVLSGDLIAGARAKTMRVAGLWQATSRVGLAGATLGVAVAGITQADLSLLLTVLACGAAFVTAVRAASSEYEDFTVRLIKAVYAELPDGASESLATSFARIRNLSLAVSLGAAIYVVYPVGRWPGPELISIAVLWFLFVGIPGRLAKIVTSYELTLRGMSRVKLPLGQNPVQLSLNLFPAERSRQPKDQAARVAEQEKQRETGSRQPESESARLVATPRRSSKFLEIGAMLAVALVAVMFVAFIIGVFVVDYVAPNWLPNQENKALSDLLPGWDDTWRNPVGALSEGGVQAGNPRPATATVTVACCDDGFSCLSPSGVISVSSYSSSSPSGIGLSIPRSCDRSNGPGTAAR
jgi:hypothetical protein